MKIEGHTALMMVSFWSQVNVSASLAW